MKIINFLKTIRFIRAARKYFEPDKKFLNEARITFLQRAVAKDARFAKSRLSIFPLFPYHKIPAVALASIFIIFVMSSGAVALAEKQNVDPHSPLYGLKRMAEQAQVQFATKLKKTELHEKFAKRRLQEMKQIKSEIQNDKNTQQKMIEKQQKTLEKLNENFRENITAVAEAIETTHQSIPDAEKTPWTEVQSAPNQTGEQVRIENHENNSQLDRVQESILKSDESSDRNGNKKTKRSKDLCRSVLEMIQEQEDVKNNSGTSWQRIKEKCEPVLMQSSNKGQNNEFQNIRNHENTNKDGGDDKKKEN